MYVLNVMIYNMQAETEKTLLKQENSRLQAQVC